MGNVFCSPDGRLLMKHYYAVDGTLYIVTERVIGVAMDCVNNENIASEPVMRNAFCASSSIVP